MSFPTGEDLAGFLLQQGLLDSLPIDYAPFDRVAAAAASSFAKQTGFVPFVADSEATEHTWAFSGNSVTFPLPKAFVEIDSVAIDGNEIGADDWQGFKSSTGAYSMLKLPYKPCNWVTVTGRAGAIEELPADVAEAILVEAARMAVGFEKSGITEIKVGEVSQKFATSIGTDWLIRFQETVKLYRRKGAI